MTAPALTRLIGLCGCLVATACGSEAPTETVEESPPRAAETRKDPPREAAPRVSGNAKVIAEVELAPIEAAPAESQGIAAIAERDGRRSVIVQAQVPPTEPDQAYEIWLYNSDDDAVSIGAQVTDRQGVFQGAGRLPRDVDRFRFIDVSRETIPRSNQETSDLRGHSGESILRGRL